jgi:uncharacterized DUF497 family protein
MIFQWDARKAAANQKKHGVRFHDAATAFVDPLALTFPDPDHSHGENREITVGFTLKRQCVFVAHTSAIQSGLSVLVWRRSRNENSMKKKSSERDDLRPQYDLSKLKGGVRGKYFERASSESNVVLIEPDLAELFPDSDSVNRALRLMAEAAKKALPSRRRAG